MSKKTNFISFIKLWGVLLLLGFGAIHIGYQVLENYYSLNATSSKMKEDYIAQQKKKVKQEVDRVIDLINFKLSKGNNEATKKELLELISRIRFDKEGYIFVNSLSGSALIANGKILSGNKKLWEEFPSNPDKLKNLFNLEYDAAQKPNGDYIYYSFVKLNNSEKESPKVSFIYGIKDLQWLVGAGVYLDDVEEKIAELHNELKSQIINRLLSSILVIVSAIILFLFLLNLFSKKLKNDLDQFFRFFKSAANKDILVDLEKIKFREFEKMAKSANKMLSDKVKVQQELFAEREQLFVTIRSVGDGLITTNAKGKVELMNRVAEKLTGWKIAEAKGKPLIDVFNIINERSRKKIENPVNKVLENGEIVGLANHTILISKDGREYSIGDSAAPIKDSAGNVTGVVLVFRDVTEEYRVQGELRESKERYNRLSDLTYEGIIIHKEGIIVDVNLALQKIIGYSNDELVGKNIVQFVPEKYQEKIIEMMRKDVVSPYEVEVVRKDGSVIQIETESRNIDYGNSTENMRLTAIRDITNRKKGELEILKLSNVVNQTPISIVITDADGRIEYINPKYTEVSGYSLSEVLHQNPSILKSGEHSTEFYKELWETIISGNIWTGELYNKKKGGELFWESAIISPVKNENGIITHFIAIKEDITEKKIMLEEILASKEKAEKADKMKSIFLAQMSHEIRTPINALVSMASLLRYDFEDGANEDQIMSFDVIDRAGGRIIRTIDLLLNLSEIQAGTYETQFTKFNILSEVISNIVAENKMLAKKKNIDLKLISNIDNSEIVADYYTINQIFVQLIDNAIKYTEEGGVIITISKNESDHLLVEIEDSGIGIDEEYLPSLFEPFSQEEMGYTRKYEGNGIGLTLVKTYSELNNAKLEVESRKGVGTKVRVIF